MSITNYTTPTLRLTIPDTVTPDLTEADAIYATFSIQNNEVFTKSGTDIVNVEAHAVSVHLSQTETAMFMSGSVEVQLNWLYNGERIATNIRKIDIKKNLLKKVVE